MISAEAEKGLELRCGGRRRRRIGRQLRGDVVEARHEVCLRLSDRRDLRAEVCRVAGGDLVDNRLDGGIDDRGLVCELRLNRADEIIQRGLQCCFVVCHSFLLSFDSV